MTSEESLSTEVEATVELRSEWELRDEEIASADYF